jgi:hypothetical protein
MENHASGLGANVLESALVEKAERRKQTVDRMLANPREIRKILDRITICFGAIDNRLDVMKERLNKKEKLDSGTKARQIVL